MVQEKSMEKENGELFWFKSTNCFRFLSLKTRIHSIFFWFSCMGDNDPVLVKYSDPFLKDVILITLVELGLLLNAYRLAFAESINEMLINKPETFGQS